MAELLGCSVRSLQRWRKRRILPRGCYHRRGTRWTRYDPDAVLRELEERRER
jgi:hypothetical protein